MLAGYKRRDFAISLKNHISTKIPKPICQNKGMVLTFPLVQLQSLLKQLLGEMNHVTRKRKRSASVSPPRICVLGDDDCFNRAYNQYTIPTLLLYLDNKDVLALSHTCNSAFAATSSSICSSHSLKVPSKACSLPPTFCRQYNAVCGIKHARQAYHILGLLPVTHLRFRDGFNMQVREPCGYMSCLQ